MDRTRTRPLLAVLLGGLLLSLLAGPSAAQELPVQAGRERLQQFLEGMTTLRAEFVQTLESAEGEVQQRSRGRLMIKRPGRFRWDYTDPYPQLVLADGEKLWSVDPELEKAVVRTLDGSMAASPAMLLSGEGDVEQAFTIELVKQEGELMRIYLRPKVADSDFRAVSIAFAGQRLGRLELVDNLDQVTRIEFTSLELNPALPEDAFSYQPPPGVDVIDQS